jgi:16S rRNA (guanine527-N7)-methyltransferase
MDPADQEAAVRQALVEARDLGFLGPGLIDRHIEHARGFASAVLPGPSGAPLSQSSMASSSEGGDPAIPIDGTPAVPPNPSGAPTPSSSEGGDPNPAPAVMPEEGAPSSPAVVPNRVLDLGSGGGLPGLVLALEWPASRLTLLDAGERRVEFLRRTVEVSGLEDRVRVLHSRAEVVGRDPQERGSYDLVVARSFGPPPVTAECAAPMLRVGGLLVVSEPPGEDGTTGRWSVPGLASLGMSRSWSIRGQFGYRVILQGSACPEQFPRRVGVPAKRPLF